MSPPLQTRQTLIDRVRYDRDEAAWDEFSAIYKTYIYMVVRGMQLNHHDALDIVQEVMIVLFKKLPEIKIGGDAPRFRQWLSTVTRNAARSFIRSAKRRVEMAEDPSLADRYCSIEQVSLPEVEEIARREWETLLYNKAFARIKERFTGNAIAAFESSLNKESAVVVAERLDIAVDSVYRLRVRVKRRLMDEVEALKREMKP